MPFAKSVIGLTAAGLLAACAHRGAEPAAVDFLLQGVGDLQIDRLPALGIEKEVGRLGAQVGLREGSPV